MPEKRKPQGAQITDEQIARVMREAKDVQLADEVTFKLSTSKVSISLTGLKSLWPKVRPAMLAAVSILKLFGRSAAANGIAQVIVIIDLMAGGSEIPE